LSDVNITLIPTAAFHQPKKSHGSKNASKRNDDKLNGKELRRPFELGIAEEGEAQVHEDECFIGIA